MQRYNKACHLCRLCCRLRSTGYVYVYVHAPSIKKVRVAACSSGRCWWSLIKVSSKVMVFFLLFRTDFEGFRRDHYSQQRRGDGARAQAESGPDPLPGEPNVPVWLRLRRELHQRNGLQVNKVCFYASAPNISGSEVADRRLVAGSLLSRWLRPFLRGEWRPASHTARLEVGKRTWVV